MGRMTLETRRRVVNLSRLGMRLKAIKLRLEEEGIRVSKTSLCMLLKKYKETGTVADRFRPRSQAKKLQLEHLRLIDEAIDKDDEVSNGDLRKMLQEEAGILVSKSTIQRTKKHLGWVSSLPHYCQMIRENNKWKQLLWCLQQTINGEKFKDVIWSDECSVMIERKRKTYRRVGQPRKFKPKPKHPLKVHIWGAISTKGAAPLVIFTENLTAIRFGKIIESSLVPFIREKFPVAHKFQMDNDPKHTSNYVRDFLEGKGIYWWKTPAESPDLNPIEKVWESMKNFLRDVYFRKLENRNLVGLKAGIKKFWKTLTPKLCRRYINHIFKVMPIIIQHRGEASGH